MAERKDREKFCSDLCRMCLGSTDVTVHIGTIIDKIRYSMPGLTVEVGDRFPQYICTTCDENMDIVFYFKSLTLLSDKEWSEILARDKNIQVSNDPLNEQESSTQFGDSCVNNKIDSDELNVVPVKVINESSEVKTTEPTDINKITIVDSGNHADNLKQGFITNKLEIKRIVKTLETIMKKKNVDADLKQSST